MLLRKKTDCVPMLDDAVELTCQWGWPDGEMTKFALGLDAGKRRWTGQWADVDVCKQ